MNHLSDDELGARLRSALQDVTPLATDPVPELRVDEVGENAPAADVIEIGAGPDRSRARRRVAAGTILAAAVAAATTVLVTAVTGPGHVAGPTVDSTPAGPVRIPLGETAWRCTAPAGVPIHVSTIRPNATAHDTPTGSTMSMIEPPPAPVLMVDARDTCVPIAVEDSDLLVVDGEVRSPVPNIWGTRVGADDDGARFAGSRSFLVGDVPPADRQPYLDALDTPFFGLTNTTDGAGPFYTAVVEPWFFGPPSPGAPQVRHLYVGDDYIIISHGSQDHIDFYRPGSTLVMLGPSDAPATPTSAPAPSDSGLPTATASLMPVPGLPAVTAAPTSGEVSTTSAGTPATPPTPTTSAGPTTTPTSTTSTPTPSATSSPGG